MKADNSKASSRQRYYQSYISAKSSEQYIKLFESGKERLKVVVEESNAKVKSSYTIEDYLLYCDEVLGRKQIFTAKVDESKLKRYTELAIKLSKDAENSTLLDEFASLSEEILESGFQLSRDVAGIAAEKEPSKVKQHKDFKEGRLVESKTPKFRVRQLTKKPLLINPRDIKDKKQIEEVYLQSGVNYILASDVKVLLLTGEKLFSDINTQAVNVANASIESELHSNLLKRLTQYIKNIEGKNEEETVNELNDTAERMAKSLVNRWARYWVKNNENNYGSKEELFEEKGPIGYEELIDDLKVDIERMIPEDLTKPVDDILSIELEDFVEDANVMPVNTESDLTFESAKAFREEITNRRDEKEPVRDGKDNYAQKIGITSKYDIIDVIATIADMAEFFLGNLITQKAGGRGASPIFKTVNEDGVVNLNELETILKKHLDEIKRAIIDEMGIKMKEILEEHRHFYRASKIRRGSYKTAGAIGTTAGEDAYTGTTKRYTDDTKSIIDVLIDIKLMERI